MPEAVPASQAKLECIPARTGRAIRLSRGQSIRLINTHGGQVVDTWAFNAHDLSEKMSMEHTRARLDKILPAAGDTFITNRQSEIITFVEDTSPGHHDALIPACNALRYEKQYGLTEYHDNCADNLRNALRDIGEEGEKDAPSPFNVFMHVAVQQDGKLLWEPSSAGAGQYIVLRAEMDVIVVFSACPNDVKSINGHKSKEAHYEVLVP